MSEVTEKLAGVTSYSGFLTVNETYNGNMFFWFFPAQVIIKLLCCAVQSTLSTVLIATIAVLGVALK